ncbi:DUF445 domain-containing protein [Taibaiella sp. KBW10]|uniref:DUF445 domain-containing protein n=1 Tax=Taibaiella sp. KBW10 TaxID=2153357 RepID=UPI000F5A9843|nr:DUF445 domain-containing protein [Taibaiella sp. KBW10]RQO30621.1 DUF445 domain-containing protein [Taibaiella sp. KBW10]
MTNAAKKVQLRKYKFFATGLFLLMMVIFIGMTVLQKQYAQEWMGYVKAFAEAAMVGALADWFAVTALFHYPMGLRIPHTNLIENSKQRIGDNLGSFVVDNFLTPENIKPYILKLDIARYIAEWLQKEQNKTLLLKESSGFLHKIVSQLDDRFISEMIAKKGKEFLNTINVNTLLANGIVYLIDKGAQEKIISFIAEKLKVYITENEPMVRERVKQESSALIPGFVDNLIAKKITNGLSRYFEEIELNKQHKVRQDIINQLLQLANDIKVKPNWEQDLNALKQDLLASEKTDDMAKDIWSNIKSSLLEGLNAEQSGLKQYIAKAIQDLSETFSTDETFSSNTNKWIRYNAYKAILKNKSKAGELISNTVGTWQGRDLSEKLELEVGKDLQFIRVNGTLVGGLVGLVIYTIVHLLL